MNLPLFHHAVAARPHAVWLPLPFTLAHLP